MTNVILRLWSLALGVSFSYLLVRMSDQEHATWIIEFFTISLVLSTLFDFGGSGDIIRMSDQGGLRNISILHSMFPIPILLFCLVSIFSFFADLDFMYCVGGLLFTAVNRLTTAHRFGKCFTFSYLANELVHNSLKLLLVIFLWLNSSLAMIELYALLTIGIPILVLLTKDSGRIERKLTHSFKYTLGSFITTIQAKFPLLFVIFHGQSELSQTNFVLSVCTGCLGLVFAYANKFYSKELSGQKVKVIPKIAYITLVAIIMVAIVLQGHFLFELTLVVTTVALVVQNVLLNPVFTKTGRQTELNKIDFLQVCLVFSIALVQQTLVCVIVSLCFLTWKVYLVRQI